MAATVLAVAAAASAALAEGPGSVSTTLHNLSARGPGEVRAVSETEVCKFCHIPHSAVVAAPLWGHALSTAASYAVPDVKGPGGALRPGGQPDGASRLCLSCHDGTVALGDLGRKRGTVPMAGAQKLGAGRRGFLGTDLSGSHPISIEMPVTDPAADDDADVGLRPLQAVQADREVRLDRDGKIQCTTCHDPHADRYHVEGQVPRFWVKPTVEEVCLVCHQLR